MFENWTRMRVNPTSWVWMAAVRCPSDTGYKSRAARLACALNARYSNREGAYIMSQPKARRLSELFNAGWDASTFGRELQAPEVAHA